MKSDAIINAVQGVTKKWAKQRKREEREASAAMNRGYAMTRWRGTSIKEAAWQVMHKAYLKASGNDTLPAHARQVMYAARPDIQRIADRPLSGDFDKYFTQTLLPDYINQTGVKWNVVFDARGHFLEPHTGKEVPLGTLQVRDYLALVKEHTVGSLDFKIRGKGYPTLGPKNRFGAILFIEKEGFMPLFEEVKLAERYDIAIMSTKGMSVTASRELVDVMCAKCNIPLLVLHDFDKSGFSILGTLQADTRRYRYRNRIKVIDLGLRIQDIDGLETEDVDLGSSYKIRDNLLQNGATEDEVDFLLEHRVELNAFPSDQFITWIEKKLEAHGICKVIPDDDTLADAYRRMTRQAVVQARIDEVLDEMDDETKDLPVPGNLRTRIEAAQRLDPERRWDAIVRELVIFRRGAEFEDDDNDAADEAAP